MPKYKVLKEFSTGPEEARVIYQEGAEVELNPDHIDIPTFIADGFVELVADAPAPTMVDYVVVKGPVKIGEETYQAKNEMKLADSDPSIEALLNDGTIMLKSDFDALPKEPISPAPINETAEVTAPEVAGATEPRARYRGKVVILETERTVGTQTFKHIALETGDELDLTDREYAAEVKISYPPQA